MNREQQKAMLEEILRTIQIPDSAHDLAEKRYQSMTDWFKRDNSTLTEYDILIYPQGSFRIGTVIRPVSKDGDYDLDLVCRVMTNKENLTQKELKAMIGVEVIAYSKAQNFKRDPEDKTRCWTQEYQESGGTGFHMDILPAVPEDQLIKEVFRQAGADEELVEHMLSITDKDSKTFDKNDPDWPNSNPKGLALWFEEQMNRGGFIEQARKDYNFSLSQANRAEVEVEEVPTSRLKTPLQLAIQLLKHHRDQMYQGEDSESKPISIIITTLAARAYGAESDFREALLNILNRMGDFVGPKTAPVRIPNPVAPTEDFADRWDDHLEECFWTWLNEAKRHFALIGTLTEAQELKRHLKEVFGTEVDQGLVKRYLPVAPAIIGGTAAPLNLTSGAGSWAAHG